MRVIAFWLVVALVALLLGALWLLQPSKPARAPAPETVPPPARAEATTVAPAATEPAASPSLPARAARANRKAKVDAPAAGTLAPALVLKVNSDVPGASVFLDRNYVGTTPLTTGEVSPGSHVVQVAAEGYENQSKTVEVSAGTNDVMVRFKVVRLNEAIPVVHKHTIGSCEGRLVADLDGLRYETSGDHAFSIPFAEVRAFEVDYLKKNLRVTRRDGKTFNFTDGSPNADALFVFHKKVGAARAKLAAGFAPEK